jgi:hypothetical protein
MVTFLLTDHVGNVISIYINLNNISIVSIMELLYEDGLEDECNLFLNNERH